MMGIRSRLKQVLKSALGMSVAAAPSPPASPPPALPVPPPPPAPPPPPHPRAEEFRGLVAQKRWFHGWELVPGVTSPGHIQVDGKGYLDSLNFPEDMTGKTAIDVGTWDGYLAFELARRGCRVLGFDIQDPDRTGFNTAKYITGLDVEYIHSPNGVYDLPEVVGNRTFDYVFMIGLFTSVKAPLVAFERMATLMHEDSVLYFEGETFALYAEDRLGKPVTGAELERIAQSDIGLTMCLPHRYKGGEDWFVPNLAALKIWIEVAGMEIIELHPMLNSQQSPPKQRVIGWARKVRSSAMAEHELI